MATSEVRKAAEAFVLNALVCERVSVACIRLGLRVVGDFCLAACAFRSAGRFPEDAAKFYIACVVEAFAYLHSRSVSAACAPVLFFFGCICLGWKVAVNNNQRFSLPLLTPPLVLLLLLLLFLLLIHVNRLCTAISSRRTS